MTVSFKIAALPLLALSVACASATPPPSISPTAEPSMDGLYPVDNAVLQYAEAKRDLDLSHYDAFILGPVDVAYQKDPGVRTVASRESNFALTPRQMQTLKETFREEIERALTADDGYELVSEPGPNVLRLDAYLLDLIVRFDAEATVGRNSAYTASYGEVTMILELRDSQSGEILARVGERRDPTRSTFELVEVRPTFVRGDVTAMFRHWGTTLRERLDAVRAANLSGEDGVGRGG
jgi:hypothetical protein